MRSLPDISASDMTELARIWRRGQEAFRRIYDRSLVGEGGVFHIVKRPTVDEETVKLTKTCNTDKLVDYVNTYATEKTGRAAYFQAVLCLGTEILKKEEEARKVVAVG